MTHRRPSGIGLLLLALMLALPVLMLAPSPSKAQQPADQKVLDFARWDKTASRAEATIEKAEASSAALEELRATLADFRAQALDVQNQNQARIDTLKSQLDALGPPPAEGVKEADEVARRRSELNQQLSDTMAPILAAQEAYRRANGLIGEIDKIIRDRLADQLLTLGVSPLNPVYWPEAITGVADLIEAIGDEVTTALNSDTQKVQTRQNLPASLLLVALGLVLLTRARRWMLKAFGLMPEARSTPVGDIRAILISTTQVIVPMLGIAALMQGLELTHLVGIKGGLVLSALLPMGLAFFGGRWLARTLFSNADGTPLFFATLTEADNRAGQRYAALLGLVMALAALLQRLDHGNAFSQPAMVVLSFPVLLVAGLLLLRIGALMDPGKLTPGQPDNPLQRRIVQLIARIAIVLGLVAPVLAAIGYYTASISMVYPAILTLAVFGVGLILFRLLADLSESLLASALQSQDEEEDEENKRLSLVPVALGFFLFAAAIPLLALIWGARVSDLQEVWNYVNDGFSIGDTRITIRNLLLFVLVFSIGYTLTRLLQSALRTSVMPRTSLDAGGRNAILTGTGYVGIFLAAVAAISTAGIDLSNLAIVAGALSVGIGFGLQAIVSNFVSGVILLIERPISEGDWIEVGGQMGTVRSISVRSTRIETFDRSDVIVPNADLISSTVTNYTRGNTIGRAVLQVGVAYDSDVDRVIEILSAIARAHPMVIINPPPSVYFVSIGAESFNFEIRAILRDVNWILSVKSDLYREIVRQLAAENIEMPYSTRDIWLRNPETLRSTPPPASEGQE